jgi:hypothetical protein
MNEAASVSIPQFHLVSGAATHVGCVRKLNEDSYLDRADLGLWAVADGMGGHDAGDHASQRTIAALDQIAPPTSAPAFLAAVKSALRICGRRPLIAALVASSPARSSPCSPTASTMPACGRATAASTACATKRCSRSIAITAMCRR